MSDNLNQAISVLKSGGVIIFPTDTVWGIGASLESSEGISKLYQIKNRPNNKPTAVLVSNLSQAEKYGSFNPQSRQIASTFWPGALTLIVPAIDNVPTAILGENNSVGIRVPDFPLIQSLCHRLNSGIVTGSANITSGVTPQKLTDIDPHLLTIVDYVIKGDAGGGVASTVLNTTTTPPTLLRQGPVIIKI